MFSDHDSIATGASAFGIISSAKDSIHSADHPQSSSIENMNIEPAEKDARVRWEEEEGERKTVKKTDGAAHEKDKKLKHDKLNCLQRVESSRLSSARPQRLRDRNEEEKSQLEVKTCSASHVRLDWLLIVYLTIMVLMHKVQVSFSLDSVLFSSAKFKFTFIKVLISVRLRLLSFLVLFRC
jgi:hypothetical protein